MVFNPIKGIVSGKQPQNYGKSPFSMAKSTISMAIFNSYVKLPEGSVIEYPLVICYSLLLKIWKLHIEIVDLPNLKMVIYHSYVSLPEGNKYIL